MKLMNYDPKTLIYQNVRTDMQKAGEIPQSYTKAQYTILCRLIRQKKVKKNFFDFLLDSLFGLKDWKQLNYVQMYEIIHVLTFWNYQTGTERTES